MAAAAENGSSNGDAGAYKPRNILLTGGAGFIGSHVALRLIQQHPEYKVCARWRLRARALACARRARAVDQQIARRSILCAPPPHSPLAHRWSSTTRSSTARR